jgi:uncharacterized membrane protein
MEFLMQMLIGLGVFGVFVVLVIILPVAAFLRTRRLFLAVSELRLEFSRVERQIKILTGSVQTLKAEGVPPSTAPRPEAAPPHSAPAPAPPAPPAVAPSPAVWVPTVSASVAAVVVHEPFTETGAAVRAYATTPAAPPVAAASAPVPVPPPPAMAADASSGTSGAADTLETRIGGRGLLYVGMATLLLGVAFFIKYAFDNEWINETARVALGGLAGVGMVLGGHRISQKGLRLYGNVVAGGGFVALYFSAYASFTFYGLISQPVAFALMVGITAAAAFVADREKSQGLALVAVVGGFLTPFLVGRDENAQAVLLTYDAILIAGTTVLARRQRWPSVNLASYGLTIVTFAGWASRYYSPDSWATTEFFLSLYCAMFVGIAWLQNRDTLAISDAATPVLWSAPFVYHVASLNNLLPHSLPLLVYLTLVTLVGVLGSVRFDRPWVRLAAFAGTMPVFLQWLARHATPGWLFGSVVVMVALYGMHLIAQGERISRKHNEPWPLADLVLFHLNGLALFGAGYLVVGAAAPDMTPWLAVGLALWQLAMAAYFGALTGDAGVNSLALAFAFVGFAIGLLFNDWLAITGWAVESLAVVWGGLKCRRDWMRLGGVLLLTGTMVRLMSFGFFDPVSGFTPVFNSRVGVTLIIVAACYGLAYLHHRFGADASDKSGPEIATSIIVANVLTVMLVSTEISFYWKTRAAEDATADLARLASLSIAWALYGTALIIIGINRRYAPVRYVAIALLAMTVAKVFLVDLSAAGGIYRIIGFIGLGLALLLGAWLYQRYRDVILGSGE